MEFDVPRHIGAVTRKVVAGERDGQPTRTVLAGRSFATDIERCLGRAHQRRAHPALVHAGRRAI